MSYQTAIQQFSKLKVLVIGELMLDVYLYGTSNRICREAPVPVVNVTNRENVPGGAANAAVNLAAMGVHTYFLSVTGDDHEGHLVIDSLKKAGVDTQGVLCDPARTTLTKKRVLSGEQLIVRYDYGDTEQISPTYEALLISLLTKLYLEVDAVLISDYGYGILTDKILDTLKRLQEHDHKVLMVDSKNLPRYHDLHPGAVKPNYQEALYLLKLEKESQRVEQIIRHGQEILEMTGASIAAITVDSDGAVIFERGKAPYRTYARPVPDSKAAGAGDTYASALTAALTLRLSPLEAAEIAAGAASVVVHKSGTATCSSEELVEFFNPPNKIVADRRELMGRISAYREQGRKIVFTNGCFDILHRGHITFLGQASELGDILIVGINSDESVRRLKGAERPINSLEDRMHVLAALDCIDHVISFNELTADELIKVVKPDVFVKGGDYSKTSISEARLVESLGGRVEVLSYVVNRSTSDVIKKIRRGA